MLEKLNRRYPAQVNNRSWLKGNMNIFGKKICKYREQAEITRIDASEKLRICEGSMRRLEAGNRKSFPSSYFIHMASYLFKKPTSYLFVLAGYDLVPEEGAQGVTFGGKLDPREIFPGDGYTGGRFIGITRNLAFHTRGKLASFLNISLCSLWSIESGMRKNLPNPGLLHGVSDFYGVTMPTLVGKYGYIV